MPDLYLISPFFSKNRKIEARRIRNWNNWQRANETVDTFSNLGIKKVYAHIPSVGYKTIDGAVQEEFIDILSKGSLIRRRFATIDSRSSNDYMVYIDGDGQIDFNYVFEIIKFLKSGEKIVFSCRGKVFGIDNKNGKKAKTREQIERFELFLVSEFFNVHLPDGQCGFWGFTCDILNFLALKASGFEIELDLLISSLRLGYDTCFLKIDVKSEETSLFSEDIHNEKLKFLIREFCLSAEILRALYDKYTLLIGKPLEEKYLAILSNSGVNLSPKKMPKCHKICTNLEDFEPFHPCYKRT